MESDQKFNLGAGIVIVVAIFLAVYLTKDLLAPLLLSFLLAYVFYPVYSRLLDKTRRKSLSSFLTMLLILGIVLLPTFGFISILVQEVSHLVGRGGLVYIQAQVSVISEAFRGFVVDYLPAQFADRLESMGDIGRTALLRVAPIVQAKLLNFASTLPLYATYVLVAAFFTYYLLIDGRDLINRAVGLMPKRDVMSRFLMELDAIYSSLFRLFFVTAAIMAVIGAVGYLFLGVPYPGLLGILTGVTSLVPMVGPVVIFVPIAVYFLALQDYVRALATLFFGIVFLGVLPGNFILPRLASRGAAIHPLITLLAFTAPLLVVGIIGMILGPAIYGFVLAVFRTWIYFRERPAGEAGEDTYAAPVTP